MRLRIALLALTGLVACGGGSGGLRDIGTLGEGPDEFSVIPSRPLVLPDSFAVLPTPTPGGRNLTDPSPRDDALVALGGNPGVQVRGGIPSGDSALVAGAGRFGTEAGIRTTLAREDAAFRSGAARLARGPDRYFRVYARQALDAYAEFQRLRNLGIAVPTAPPPGG